MTPIDWVYAVGTIAAHISLLVILIWCETSFALRWLSTAVVARVCADYILLTPMNANQYFWCYYIFEVIGFALMFFAWVECKRLITKSEIGWVMLVYLIPESLHVCAFLMKEYVIACKFADVLRPIYLGCILYMCSILIKRKRNPYVE